MTLQSDQLTALGLGLADDHSPIPTQPILNNGIYLRYATSFEEGLPWHGFYLFRRKHRSATKQCLAKQLVRIKPQLTKKLQYDFSGVSLYSGGAIAFIDEFPAKGTAEIVLPAEVALGARFAQAPVYRITAKVGFRGAIVKGNRNTGRARKPTEPPRQVRMVAKDIDAIVGSTIISGRPGDVVTGEIVADRITAVEFHYMALSPKSASKAAKPTAVGTKNDYAALIDLCWDTVANALSGRWQRVPGYSYPMALPVAEASYPCAGKPVSQVAAEALALSRVRYGSPSNWGRF